MSHYINHTQVNGRGSQSLLALYYTVRMSEGEAEGKGRAPLLEANHEEGIYCFEIRNIGMSPTRN